jgi:peroxiredoxin
VLAVLVVLLSRQNMKLKEQISAMSGTVPLEDALKAGDPVDSLTLIDEAGVKQPLAYDQGEERTVLLVFSMDCPACEQTLPIWSELFSGPQREGIRVLGVDLDRGDEEDSGASPLLPTALPFAVYGAERAESGSLEKVPYIPATVIVDRDGIVEKTWFGVLSEDDQDEVRRNLAP